MNAFVLFGITGDLAKTKVIPALSRLSASGNFVFIGAGRKPLPPIEFEILPNSTYVQGDIQSTDLHNKISKIIEEKIKGLSEANESIIKGSTKFSATGLHINLIMYSSLPPELHEIVAKRFSESHKKLIKTYAFNHTSKKKISIDAKILIEKPVGNSLNEAKKSITEFAEIKKTGFNVLYVDHYLTKEAILGLETMSVLNPELLVKILPSKAIKEIKVVLYEKEGIRDRGAFYDKIGALYDVGQNHLLQTLVNMIVFIEGNPKVKKMAILKRLQIYGSPVFWQYHGYTHEKNVDPNSMTETFFSASFKLKGAKAEKSEKFGETDGTLDADKNLDTIFTISSGKALELNKSGIEVHFHNNFNNSSQNLDQIFIDIKKSKRDAYEIMFETALSNDHTLHTSRFAKEDEIIECWKIVERLKKLKTKVNLVVYKKLHDIMK